jgi:hypothetical protein
MSMHHPTWLFLFFVAPSWSALAAVVAAVLILKLFNAFLSEWSTMIGKILEIRKLMQERRKRKEDAPRRK